ncbi:MAG: redoxin [Rubrivivax sp. SCN 70-15]|nr:MAG: redoxin [Rubrivivax sp. SCN 70-15]
MNRRSWLVAGAGAAAAAAGVGWQLRRERQHQEQAERGLASLWPLRFPRPEGGELALADFRGRPLLINFWAPWCPPCVKELPALNRFQKAFAAQGWQVVGLAIDEPPPVRAFLKKLPLDFPVGIAGFAGADLSRRLGNADGALPFTVILDAAGHVARRQLGESQYEDLVRWAKAI